MTTLTIYYTEQAGRSSDELLREVASLFTGRPPEAFGTVREPGHKPYFAAHPEIRASVSHSGGIWAAALSREADVGLDIQTETRIRKMDGIARRFYHPAERAAYEASPEPGTFFRIWCRKEAAAKQFGRGIDGSFASFDVTRDECAVFGETLFLRDFRLPDFPALFCAAAYPEAFEVRTLRF